MTDLHERKCRPCEGGVEPLTTDQAVELMSALHPDWALSESGQDISREFEFAGFSRTIAFANAVAWVAITEGHHPEMTVRYGSCLVRYTTTAIDGLSDNDFICAAKIDRMAAQ
jgi:4a-hydroxytetrahydrobiopterin dehydratase